MGAGGGAATQKNGIEVLRERGFVRQCTDLEALEALAEKEPVTFYVGLDPTGGSLHVGHMVPVMAVAHLAKAGHNPIIIIGGGTARIGDPSGKTEMRRMLSVEQINEYGENFKRQIGNVLATQGVEPKFVDNAEWLTELNYIDFLRDIGRHFSVNRMLSFEAYKQRLETGLSFIEFNYQLLQSYDFLVLNERYNCKLQIGGDDQWGNIVAGTDLIRRVRGEETYGLTFPLVTRADGKKMGKTEQGAVFVAPELMGPYDFFQYWRNVPDEDVVRFLKLYTFLPMDEINKLSGLSGREINHAKEVLATEITRMVHGDAEADKAVAASKAAFGGTEEGDTSAIPRMAVSRADLESGLSAVDLFSRTGLCSSRGEARRLIQQGGARVNEQKIESTEEMVDDRWFEGNEALLKAGKKRYFRVVLQDGDE
ncbi:MAG: tyrosine--tRNA ligase [Spirochaetota bacterium]